MIKLNKLPREIFAGASPTIHSNKDFFNDFCYKQMQFKGIFECLIEKRLTYKQTAKRLKTSYYKLKIKEKRLKFHIECHLENLKGFWGSKAGEYCKTLIENKQK